MEIHQYKNLLSQIDSLNNHYKKINELTGENFNVFRILNLESSEVRMHSAFIAELLNPKGLHGQKDTFLKLFIKVFCFRNNQIDTESCRVEVEKHTGFISVDGTEGGRLDIVVTDKHNNQIIIENKIYAGDQTNQLQRYHKYSSQADLLYLTLEGKEPSDDSKGNLIADTHYKCFSYKVNILEWLELCRKEVAIFPIVRESITQYINLIKYLTNQTLNHNMETELNDIILANLEASFKLVDGLDIALIKSLNDFTIKLEAMCMNLDLKCFANVDVTFENNYRGFFICKNDWQHLNIGFQFQYYDQKLQYGMVTKKSPNELPLELRNEIFSIAGYGQKSLWWPWFMPLEEPFNNWDKYEAWKAITDGTMLKVFEEKILNLLKLTEKINL